MSRSEFVGSVCAISALSLNSSPLRVLEKTRPKNPFESAQFGGMGLQSPCSCEWLASHTLWSDRMPPVESRSQCPGCRERRSETSRRRKSSIGGIAAPQSINQKNAGCARFPESLRAVRCEGCRMRKSCRRVQPKERKHGRAARRTASDRQTDYDSQYCNCNDNATDPYAQAIALQISGASSAARWMSLSRQSGFCAAHRNRRRIDSLSSMRRMMSGAIRRTAARFSAPWPARFRRSSYPVRTSRTQCGLFSIAQRFRTAFRSSSGDLCYYFCISTMISGFRRRPWPRSATGRCMARYYLWHDHAT